MQADQPADEPSQQQQHDSSFMHHLISRELDSTLLEICNSLSNLRAQLRFGVHFHKWTMLPYGSGIVVSSLHAMLKQVLTLVFLICRCIVVEPIIPLPTSVTRSSLDLVDRIHTSAYDTMLSNALCNAIHHYRHHASSPPPLTCVPLVPPFTPMVLTVVIENDVIFITRTTTDENDPPTQLRITDVHNPDLYSRVDTIVKLLIYG